MPFTFSHPAIILPLNYLPKKYISLTGLVIGSMTPDFEYFIRMKIQSNYSHTLLGIFWFDLPLGLLLTFVFHNFIKNDLFKNLPRELNQRFINYEKLNWNKYFYENWKTVVLSLIIGSLSHIFWDSFTHENGFFVNLFSELSSQITIYGKNFKVYKILQHSSTLIGGILISWIIFKLPKVQTNQIKINSKYWLVLLLSTVLIFLIKISFVENSTKIGNLIVSLISSFIIGLILTPSILNRKSYS